MRNESEFKLVYPGIKEEARKFEKKMEELGITVSVKGDNSIPLNFQIDKMWFLTSPTFLSIEEERRWKLLESRLLDCDDGNRGGWAEEFQKTWDHINQVFDVYRRK